ncbi:carboxylesterase/lipase family protein [Spirosoma rhododendri]|uniref:Carboxylic ester hydrolase n=1 Tax=Spirosoma rhododendri TaxID=2728024 RepID=A0A7L5DLR5_9BACT|nr:carboxylesterase family protein [Spirosoma rhododendri]QJD79409.1 carboxylesterase family protein [Spirosoma rhododendri]
MKQAIVALCLTTIALTGLLAVSPSAKDEPVVQVTGGRITGVPNRAGDVYSYKGIPFAAPPVGVLRWKAPQPVVPWSGVRRADAFGPSPVQGEPNPFGPWSAEYLIPKAPISEDCLYLNVWTSTQAARKKPVLVWIYGGGFGSGGSGVPIYDGEATAPKGIVFVSVNYRVGPFGFFAHPELTRESSNQASGNYGLMDQIAALKWVQQNIARFGGDPANVTIAGQSAGSMSVNCLVASPLAKGLFTKAIAQSGARFATPYPSLREAEADGQKTAQALGASTLAELRALPAEALLKQSQAMRGPIIDGYVLPASIAQLFADRKQNPVSLLTGWNEDEGLAFGPQKSAADYKAQLDQQYGSRAETMLRYYPAGSDAEAAQSQRNIARDRTFGAQNYQWAVTQAQQRLPVYVYRFTRKVPATGEYASYGAFHTAEVPYAYDNLRFIDKQLRPLRPADDQLARAIATYWANFIKTGNPNGSGLPHWPAFSAPNDSIMQLDTVIRARPLPDRAALTFLFSTLRTP